jgi:hypothetical protein
MSREVVECPKCHGAGRIEAFYHVLSGVCFCCKGQKTIVVDIEANKASLSADTRRKAEWIMSSTEDSYIGLSYERLLAIREFAHGGWGLREAYPELRSHYFAVGEWAFQAAQEEMLANLVI